MKNKQKRVASCHQTFKNCCRDPGDSVHPAGDHIQGERAEHVQQAGEDGALPRQGSEDAVPAAGVRGGPHGRRLPGRVGNLSRKKN